MQKITILTIALLLALPVAAKQDEKKGYGAGGVREEHASDMGLEKGKAWSGNKEKNAKEGTEDTIRKGKNPKKGKKENKATKSK